MESSWTTAGRPRLARRSSRQRVSYRIRVNDKTDWNKDDGIYLDSNRSISHHTLLVTPHEAPELPAVTERAYEFIFVL